MLDPISPVAIDPRTLNRYSYAANNPHKYIDPTGEIFFVPVVAFLAKEVIAEVASHYTNGATDILSVRRMATKAVKYGAKSLATKKADDVVEKSTDFGSDVPNNADESVEVFRVFGGDARAQGISFTTVDPRTVTNFRDAAGLPSGGACGANNTADFLLKGTANKRDIIKSLDTLTLDGNSADFRN